MALSEFVRQLQLSEKLKDDYMDLVTPPLAQANKLPSLRMAPDLLLQGGSDPPT